MVDSIFPLKTHALTVRRRGKCLLGPIDLTLPENGFTIVLGPNGAGKSTLLKALHGMERATGEIRWRVPFQTALKRQAFVFQTPIVMRRNVLQNVEYPLKVKGLNRNDARQWLHTVGLDKKADQRASDLSGGERQKMAMARAMAVRPELLFLDEPSANLDGRATKEIETILANASADGVRIIMATHDLGQARRLATDVLFLNKGRLLEHSPANTFFDAPRTPEARAFLNGDIIE